MEKIQLFETLFNHDEIGLSAKMLIETYLKYIQRSLIVAV